MAVKQPKGRLGDVTIPAATYQGLVETMVELAHRGAKEEALVMRIANAGDIAEVRKHFKDMRLYLKKMRPGRTQSPAPAGTSRKPRSKRNKGQGQEDGAGATG